MNETHRGGGGIARDIAPFAFAKLPVVTRAEIAAQKRVRGWPVHEMAQALTTLLGVDVSLVIRAARPAERTTALSVTAAFAPSDEPARVLVVDAEPPLARELVMRALKTPPTALADPVRAGGAELHGAFAAVVHAALRRTSAPPLRVIGTSAPSPAGITAWLAVTIAGATFDARVTGSFTPPARVDLPELSIGLPLVVATCLASRSDIEALRPGDVFVPPKLTLSGPVALVAPREERGISADLAEGGRLVVRTERFAHQAWDVAPMSEPHTTLEVALDAPVVVRVELGTVEMKAREWAALGEGDVIALGRKIGDPAVIRVGGVEVARGELVQVDGEYGIRIVGTTR